MILEYFSKLARLVQPAGKLLLVIAIFCLGFISINLMQGFNADTEVYLLPALAVALWYLLAYLVANLFYQLPEHSFFKRSRLRIKRAWYWLLATLFIGLTIVTLVLTLRLLNIWRLAY